jgi:hypothetical protein
MTLLKFFILKAFKSLNFQNFSLLMLSKVNAKKNYIVNAFQS